MDTYEKKYKEAQKWIESIYPNLSHEQQMEAEAFFPELKESEDGKIRKFLIKWIQDNYYHGTTEIPTKTLIAWLEKQGETVWSEETDDDAWLNDIISKVESGCTLNSSEIKWLKSIKDKINIHYWTEEEVEPIISDYLRGAEHYGGMIGRLRCLKPKSLEKQRTSYTKSDVDDAYLKGLSDAKNELEKQGDSPIKWNKNTEGNKPQVNHSVLMKTTHGIAEGEWQGGYWHQYRWAGIVRDSDVLSWMELSDLEKQGEQEPAWSEKDEKEYKYVLKFVDNILNNCGNKKDYEHCKRCYDWLKSLKQRIGG